MPTPNGQSEVVTITRAEFDRLTDDSLRLHYLEVGGVDNWEGYGESLRPYYNEKEGRDPEDDGDD